MMDFSAAARVIVEGIVAKRGNIVVPAVNVNPARTGLLRYLILMGVHVSCDNHRWIDDEPVADITVKPPRFLKPIQIEAEHLPTLINELPLLELLNDIK